MPGTQNEAQELGVVLCSSVQLFELESTRIACVLSVLVYNMYKRSLDVILWHCTVMGASSLRRRANNAKSSGPPLARV